MKFYRILKNPGALAGIFLWALSCLPATAEEWKGPTSGPPALKGQHIAFIAESLSNYGIRGVAKGVREAAHEIGWQLDVLSYSQAGEKRDLFYERILARGYNAIILGGSDPDALRPVLQRFADNQTPVVGWHSGFIPGPSPEQLVDYNVTTRPQQVAQKAVSLLKQNMSNQKAGVIIFTDSRYAIALEKSRILEKGVLDCPNCELLGVYDVPLDHTDTIIPTLSTDLLARFGARWTHALAINDLYFDALVPYLKDQGGPPIRMISAGDGSPSAFHRIKENDYQIATVAEPLIMQGWQLIDEINRLLSGYDGSGFIAPPYAAQAIDLQGTTDYFEPKCDFKQAYRQIWAGEKPLP